MSRLLSVVVPAYNVGDYIGRTISSLLAQDDAALQVVVVDDGSTDDTAARAENRLRDAEHLDWSVIRQTNRGVSAARNAGLQVVDGQYVLFLDGDDFVSAELLSSIREAGAGLTPDIIAWGFDRVSKDHPEPQARPRSTRGWTTVRSGSSVLHGFVMEGSPRIHMISAAYRRQFLRDHDRWFTEDCRRGQDREFVYTCLADAEKVLLLDSMLSFYVTRPGSVTSGYTVRNLDSVGAHLRAHEYLVDQGRTELGQVAERILVDEAGGRYLNVLRSALTETDMDISSLLAEVDQTYPGLNEAARSLLRKSLFRGWWPRWGRLAFLASPALFAGAVRWRHRARHLSSRHR